MKKCLVTCILLLLMSFLTQISPSQEMGQYLSNQEDELIISSVDTISGFDAITVSAPTIIHKWQSKSLFPKNDFTLNLRGVLVPFKVINYASLTSQVAGFISVVQHHSNYLS